MNNKQNSDQNAKSCPTFKTKIGGQALIEGIMMKGVSKTAMAVRMPDGSLDVETWENKAPKWYNKTPFVRGIFNFISSMKEGMQCMTKSAEKSTLHDEKEELTKFEKWLTEKLGENGTKIIMDIAVFLGFALAILLFFFLPTIIVSGIQLLIHTDFNFRPLVETIIKIGIFIIYIALMSRLNDIHRTFQYHGAEHKTITCYENRLELTVDNIKKQIRFHPRCGTSFIFIIFIVSIIFYSLLPFGKDFFIALGLPSLLADLAWIVVRLLFLPVIVGISYELIRLAGRYDNIFTKIISAPGLWMQRLTTKEPDASQIEAAIAAITPVLPKEGEDDTW